MRMIINRLPIFKRMYRKLSQEQKERVRKSLDIFAQNPFDPRLRNHVLSGQQEGVRSISAGHDLRILYVEQDGHFVVLLVAVGDHDEVYK